MHDFTHTLRLGKPGVCDAGNSKTSNKKKMLKKAKPYLVIAAVAIIAVMIYNNYIQPKAPNLPTA